MIQLFLEEWWVWMWLVFIGSLFFTIYIFIFLNIFIFFLNIFFFYKYYSVYFFFSIDKMCSNHSNKRGAKWDTTSREIINNQRHPSDIKDQRKSNSKAKKRERTPTKWDKKIIMIVHLILQRFLHGADWSPSVNWIPPWNRISGV